ncbi:hypothetical protein SISNIDRAFT_177777 [Sistotremastrum niveocremeum HHB9708]|uniref:Uncharacterized protein n=1 Tax=Sistotremastrum niveocremeum HHB9708 TaxID=1314777 RepID=A0A164RK06_9AGAM|nr:hypothetical protein SISNIDRAFT_177777 [Sistotremastrum niveocremeum HHB9708]
MSIILLSIVGGEDREPWELNASKFCDLPTITITMVVTITIELIQLVLFFLSFFIDKSGYGAKVESWQSTF